MKSLSKIFGIIISGALLLASPGCVVMDLEDPAEEVNYMEASWDEELFDDAVLDEAAPQEGNVEQGEGAGDEDYEVLDEGGEPLDDPWPDPFDPKEGTNGSGD
jgi:hypothetical protein